MSASGVSQRSSQSNAISDSPGDGCKPAQLESKQIVSFALWKDDPGLAPHEPGKALRDRTVQVVRTPGRQALADAEGDPVEKDFIELQLLIGERADPALLTQKLHAVLANTTGDHDALLEFVGAELLQQGLTKDQIEKLLVNRAPLASGQTVNPGLDDRGKRLLGGMGDDTKASQKERDKERLKARVNAAKGNRAGPRPQSAPPQPLEIETKSKTAPITRKDDKHSGGPATPMEDVSSAGSYDAASDLEDDFQALLGALSIEPDKPSQAETKASAVGVHRPQGAHRAPENIANMDAATAAQRFADQVANQPDKRRDNARDLWQGVLASGVRAEWRTAFLSSFVDAMKPGDKSSVRSVNATLKGALNFVSGRLIARAKRASDFAEERRIKYEAIAIHKALDALTQGLTHDISGSPQ